MSNNCWICELPVSKRNAVFDSFHVNCRTCGTYLITGTAAATTFPADVDRYLLSYWCKQRELDGRPTPKIDGQTFESIAAQLIKPKPSAKADLLLVSLSKLYPVPGTAIPPYETTRDYSLACARDGSELSYFQTVLNQREYVETNIASGRFQISHKGWDRIEELSNDPLTSRFAFVAMRFNTEMLPLWDSTFRPAIRKAQFEPLLANEPEHNERIDAKIITDIKRSRFVIADVTFKSPGVYFEAGYALGLGRPVIWTCRADHETDMHFDTRQYNNILWKDPADLESRLFLRINATI